MSANPVALMGISMQLALTHCQWVTNGDGDSMQRKCNRMNRVSGAPSVSEARSLHVPYATCLRTKAGGGGVGSLSLS
jgi:hypothetical protein